MDIRSSEGVFIDDVPLSQVLYDPFPGGFKIIPGYETLRIQLNSDHMIC